MQRYRAVVLMVLLGLMPLLAAILAARLFLFDDAIQPARAETKPVVQDAAPPLVREPTTRMVLAAARHLPVGTLLGEGDLIEQDVDVAVFHSSHVAVSDKTNVTTLLGYATREPIDAGKSVRWSAVIGPGRRGFLAAVLRPGMRAVTIRLGKGARHAGLIDPGDRVDVILTATIKVTVAAKRQRVLSRTIIENVRVVAVDRRVETTVPPDETGQKIERTEIVTATLEVSPAQANRLVLGEHEGDLSLAVRSLAAPTELDAAGEPIGLQEIMSQPLVGSQPENDSSKKKARPAKLMRSEQVVRVIRGDKDIMETFPDRGKPKSPAVR